MRVAITGGSRGIGRATAQLLLSRGWAVDVLDREKPEFEGVRHIQCDLSDDASIDAVTDILEPGYDALISNAGIPPRDGNGEKILSVNLFGTRRLARQFETLLSRGGAFVHVASLAGIRWRENVGTVRALLAIERREDLAPFAARTGLDPTGLYNLSKEAVIALAKLDTERLLAKGLRVNSVSPAATSTAILDDFKTAYGEMARRNIARIGRPGSPEECAAVIAFLANPESAWLKGVDIPVDGGLSAMLLSDALDRS